jgi:hypothetical protein
MGSCFLFEKNEHKDVKKKNYFLLYCTSRRDEIRATFTSFSKGFTVFFFNKKVVHFFCEFLPWWCAKKSGFSTFFCQKK